MASEQLYRQSQYVPVPRAYLPTLFFELAQSRQSSKASDYSEFIWFGFSELSLGQKVHKFLKKCLPLLKNVFFNKESG
jgi:hypothetical protein